MPFGSSLERPVSIFIIAGVPKGSKCVRTVVGDLFKIVSYEDLLFEPCPRAVKFMTRVACLIASGQKELSIKFDNFAASLNIVLARSKADFQPLSAMLLAVG